MPTNHQIAGLVGSLFEIAGGFLLAVEAIKTSNLLAIRAKYFEPFLRRLQPRILVRGDTPPDEVTKLKERAQRLRCDS
jgi:hypothetical protein